RLQRPSLPARPPLDPRDARGEPLVRLAERALGVEALLARRGHEIEQQLTEERRVVDVERQVDALVRDADARGALLQPLGGEERRQLSRDAGQDAVVLLPAGLALLALDALPLRE